MNDEFDVTSEELGADEEDGEGKESEADVSSEEGTDAY